MEMVEHGSVDVGGDGGDDEEDEDWGLEEQDRDGARYTVQEVVEQGRVDVGGDAGDNEEDEVDDVRCVLYDM